MLTLHEYKRYLICNRDRLYKTFFLSYGDDNFAESKNRIRKEALDSYWFDDVTIYGPDNISNNFIKKYKKIFDLPHKGNYYIWKIDIILQTLNKMNNGDVLLYCDSGCKLNISDDGTYTFFSDVNKLINSDHGIMLHSNGNLEYKYTIREIFEYLGVSYNPYITESYQVMATLMYIKKCDYTYMIFNTIIDILDHNPYFITNKYDSNQVNPLFKVNRHDQSLFSVASKVHGCIINKCIDGIPILKCKVNRISYNTTHNVRQIESPKSLNTWLIFNETQDSYICLDINQAVFPLRLRF